MPDSVLVTWYNSGYLFQSVFISFRILIVRLIFFALCVPVSVYRLKIFARNELFLYTFSRNSVDSNPMYFGFAPWISSDWRWCNENGGSAWAGPPRAAAADDRQLRCVSPGVFRGAAGAGRVGVATGGVQLSGVGGQEGAAASAHRRPSPTGLCAHHRRPATQDVCRTGVPARR